MGTDAIQTLVHEAVEDRLDPAGSWMDDHDLEGAGPVDLISAMPWPDPPTALVADCACPDFCERDHVNE
jgi:hypothetical protein